MQTNPNQVVIVPIVMKGTDAASMTAKCEEIAAQLTAAGIRVHIDDRANYNPGWKCGTAVGEVRQI